MGKYHPEGEKKEKCHHFHEQCDSLSTFLGRYSKGKSGKNLYELLEEFRKKKKREEYKKKRKFHNCRVLSEDYRLRRFTKGVNKGPVRSIYHSPIGQIVLSEMNGFLISARFFNPVTDKRIWPFRTPVLEQAARELDEYFAGKRTKFEVPMKLESKTMFQFEVWNQLKKIRYGKTVSYGEVAQRIGRPKSARAVGMANHRNPLVIFIPCHRVISADGSLSGYAGGVEVKRFLLELEKNVLRKKKDSLREKGIDEMGN